MDVSGSEQRLVKFIQGNIDFDDIELLMLNEVPYDQVKGTAIGQRKTCPANQIPGGFQIQLQRKCQCDGGLLGGFCIGIVDNLGEVLFGDIRFFIDGGILLPTLLNQFQQGFREPGIFLFDLIVQR